MGNFKTTVLRKLLKDEENYTGGIYIICNIPFIVRARIIKSHMLREARCILCGKNGRLLKVTVGKPIGKNKCHERTESNKKNHRKILNDVWIQMVWFSD